MYTERYGCGVIIKKESKMAFPKTRETLHSNHSWVDESKNKAYWKVLECGHCHWPSGYIHTQSKILKLINYSSKSLKWIHFTWKS